ncbi:unnamed protein product [Vitrella brassicaformis CCMP3155]|uniref:EGF-like domain-containing protein n=1 Tax=Vitrella brassicaformis (strain CCMP3155) TaxID=1169540 RepID=A0A0G4EUK5_VITBC|nr:unnamed protein product [Vitrella brassicaformis CCMP3155]|eukprot:CEM01906.1 unnamed protein product [Vitrella brassicaformis CCMP3155]
MDTWREEARVGVSSWCVADLNECDKDDTLCDSPPFGLCVNTKGGYHCECAAGYTLGWNNITCLDDGCSNLKCLGPVGHCNSYLTPYGVEPGCTCSDGYALDTSDGLTCVEHRPPKPNPCKDNSFYCNHGDCQVTADGGALCRCHRGWTFPSPAQPNCTAVVDVCGMARNRHHCEFGCDNSDGGKTCTCPEGFKLAPNGRNCTDIDECLVNSSLCRGPNELCVNTVGSYECQCLPGFTQTPTGACQDTDECATGQSGCEHLCVNTPGGHRCLCHEGFQLAPDGRHCEDYDECLHEEDDCEQACQNLPKSAAHPKGYECKCEHGY